MQNVAGGDGRVGRLEVQAREGEAGEERVLFEQVATSPSTCPVRQQAAAAEEATSTLTHSVQPRRKGKNEQKERAASLPLFMVGLHPSGRCWDCLQASNIWRRWEGNALRPINPEIIGRIGNGHLTPREELMLGVVDWELRR